MWRPGRLGAHAATRTCRCSAGARSRDKPGDVAATRRDDGVVV